METINEFNKTEDISSRLNYSEGYVAFIDILGFSNFVNQKENADKVLLFTDFITKFQYLYNTSPKLDIKVAFFSDSIVLTTTQMLSLDSFFAAIWIAESFLVENTGLVFRGAITKGLFYHEGTIAFGPAIIEAYKMEAMANYSRILINECIANELMSGRAGVFKDTDGQYCFNSLVIGALRRTLEGLVENKEQLITGCKEEGDTIRKLIRENINTPYADKYIWRIRPYNWFCDFMPTFANCYGFELSENDRIELKSQKINIEEFMDEYGYHGTEKES